MKQSYIVELVRWVVAAHGGVWCDTKKVEFLFGKDKEYKNGKLAKEAANKYAQSKLAEASTVRIWLMKGSKGVGSCLKQDFESRFKAGWAGGQ